MWNIPFVNPLIEVSSVEEMEKYLDFDVPVLNKIVNHSIHFEKALSANRECPIL